MLGSGSPFSFSNGGGWTRIDGGLGGPPRIPSPRFGFSSLWVVTCSEDRLSNLVFTDKPSSLTRGLSVGKKRRSGRRDGG
ncbi:hypothetical protein HBI49_041230 [Parastagonospora nodorum]|nr:hypothetical protein HBI10_024290 [Parastagonospora nodorum]KAH4245862.1 hypothetical protein HBI05_057760 [Parastagonospora nodorum]KAH4270528.1 hypothetical protein HBI03_041360 [Parastagonospora nodorum]KAH5020190.1 hypothetical protein HBI77_036840 [Parastagonospora nodorum]KAH5376971.1 hypothetical protein HBI49_041230 [Parastagonospora nodorum]